MDKGKTVMNRGPKQKRSTAKSYIFYCVLFLMLGGFFLKLKLFTNEQELDGALIRAANGRNSVV